MRFSFQAGTLSAGNGAGMGVEAGWGVGVGMDAEGEGGTTVTTGTAGGTTEGSWDAAVPEAGRGGMAGAGPVAAAAVLAAAWRLSSQAGAVAADGADTSLCDPALPRALALVVLRRLAALPHAEAVAERGAAAAAGVGVEVCSVTEAETAGTAAGGAGVIDGEARLGDSAPSFLSRHAGTLLAGAATAFDDTVEAAAAETDAGAAGVGKDEGSAGVVLGTGTLTPTGSGGMRGAAPAAVEGAC